MFSCFIIVVGNFQIVLNCDHIAHKGPNSDPSTTKWDHLATLGQGAGSSEYMASLAQLGLKLGLGMCKEISKRQPLVTHA